MKSQSRRVVITIVTVILILALLELFILYKPSREKKKNVDAVSLEPKYSTVKQNISYYSNTTGYLAKPTSPGKYPGVIMIHEWWGLNENIKQMADSLASQGYIVLAVDLYNGEVAEDSNRAGELSTGVRQNPNASIENMKEAISYLKKNENVEEIASLGWCFGGGQSLQITLNSDDINATVIYYGNLVTNESELSNIENPVLGIFGSEDTSIPVSTVNQFDSSLDKLGVENKIYIYNGVGHAFANPSGMNYAPEETEDAWIKTVSFLEKHLKN